MAPSTQTKRLPHPVATARAGGKVILLGEHAVVHGSFALAASLDRGANVQAWRCEDMPPRLEVRDKTGAWNVPDDSDLARAYARLCQLTGVNATTHATIDIPTGAGLGSSACLGVAISRALLQLRDPLRDPLCEPKRPDPSRAAGETPDSPVGDRAVTRQVIDCAMAWERVFHGNPSGVDVAVAVHGRCLAYHRERGMSLVTLASPVQLCVGDSATRSLTRHMVERVSRQLAAEPDQGRGWVRQINARVLDAQRALEQGNLERLAEAMASNRKLLQQVGLETPEIACMCDTALRAGAWACKLTGAGGGGCVIALAPGCQSKVLEAWRGLEGPSGIDTRTGTGVDTRVDTATKPPAYSGFALTLSS